MKKEQFFLLGGFKIPNNINSSIELQSFLEQEYPDAHAKIKDLFVKMYKYFVEESGWILTKEEDDVPEKDKDLTGEDIEQVMFINGGDYPSEVIFRIRKIGWRNFSFNENRIENDIYPNSDYYIDNDDRVWMFIREKENEEN